MKAKQGLNQRQFLVLTATVAVSGFLGGMVSSQLTVARPAQAQSAPRNTLVVPKGGLVFRGEDGKSVARLSSDENGGSFEVFDSAGRLGARLSLASNGGALDLGNSEGITVARFTTSSNGSGLDLSNDRGERALRLDANREGGNVAIYGSGGLVAREIRSPAPLDPVEVLYPTRKVAAR